MMLITSAVSAIAVIAKAIGERIQGKKTKAMGYFLTAQKLYPDLTGEKRFEKALEIARIADPSNKNIEAELALLYDEYKAVHGDN